ncbi:MAG: hypothetical protein JWQ21_989 [Herminiimonas sp.]|jgi:hypothetical protein|nr:hypothetical protein [Herminiimonas sp.]
MSHASEHLKLAVQHLAQATGSPRERLAQAFLQNLVWLRPKDLPGEVRNHFIRLLELLNPGRRKHDVASLQRRIDVLADDDIGALIEAVVDMFDAATRYEPLLRSPDDPENRPCV